jgi:hypothetical protein
MLVAWLAALAGAATLGSGTAAPYLVIGVPLTIAVGALVNRWWVLLVPWAVELSAVLVFLVFGVASGECDGSCTDGAFWGYVLLIGAVIFAVPATVALFIGVAGRRGIRFFSGVGDGPDPEPT